MDMVVSDATANATAAVSEVSPVSAVSSDTLSATNGTLSASNTTIAAKNGTEAAANVTGCGGAPLPARRLRSKRLSRSSVRQ